MQDLHIPDAEITFQEHRKITMTAGLTFALLFGLLLKPGTPSSTGPFVIDFNRDIRPILSNHCLKCHGPDEKQRAAGLRLDTYEGATKLLSNGKRAIVTRNTKQSELVNRIHATGPLQMPPLTANKPLSQPQMVHSSTNYSAQTTRWASNRYHRPKPPEGVESWTRTTGGQT